PLAELRERLAIEHRDRRFASEEARDELALFALPAGEGDVGAAGEPDLGPDPMGAREPASAIAQAGLGSRCGHRLALTHGATGAAMMRGDAAAGRRRGQAIG